MRKGSGFDFKGMPVRWPDGLASRWRGPSRDPAPGTPRGCSLAPALPEGQLPLATVSLGTLVGVIPKSRPLPPPGWVPSGRARRGASDALCVPQPGTGGSGVGRHGFRGLVPREGKAVSPDASVDSSSQNPGGGGGSPAPLAAHPTAAISVASQGPACVTGCSRSKSLWGGHHGHRGHGSADGTRQGRERCAPRPHVLGCCSDWPPAGR